MAKGSKSGGSKGQGRVRWEELAADQEDGIDFLEAIYEVGGASTPDQSLMRHHGREYGYVMSGTLSIQIGFQKYELAPGDSIAFDSTTPHRFFNGVARFA